MSIMYFAEDPVVVPPVDPAPVDPILPVDPPTPPVDPVDPPADPNAPPVDPIPEDPKQTKIDALQNSLDAALEELGKDPEPTPIEPTPADPAPVIPPAPADSVPPIVPTPPLTKEQGEQDAWKTEADAIRKENEDFKNSTVKELEQMKLKDEMIGLTAEIQGVIVRFPDVDPDRILYEIESGSEKTVIQIAEGLNIEHQNLVNKIAKEQGEKLKSTLDKENEGGIKVPQSAGTSPALPGTPNPVVPGNTKASQDAAWADATKAAKANLQ